MNKRSPPFAGPTLYGPYFNLSVDQAGWAAGTSGEWRVVSGQKSRGEGMESSWIPHRVRDRTANVIYVVFARY